MMECCSLTFFGTIVLLVIIYKLFDVVWRWPRVGRYTDRYILVTGCDTGFGNNLARRLDLLGCHVFAACLTEKGETELRKGCSSRLMTLSLDVRNADNVRQAYEFVKGKLPTNEGLWAVVNNAGIFSQLGPLEWVTLDDYRRVFGVNSLGLVDVTMTFLPLVKLTRGRIVNMSSTAGRLSGPLSATYAVSKYAVEAFTDALRRGLYVYGCKAILIEPGFHNTGLTAEVNIDNDFNAGWNQASPEIKKEFGEEYLEHVKRNFDKSRPLMSSRISDVTDAYEHALFSRHPRGRYVVGFDAKFIWWPISLMPDWLGDWVLRLLASDPAIPDVIKKRT